PPDSRYTCVILCDSTPRTGALRVLERDVRDESPTTQAARMPANDAGVCQTFDPERRYERGGSSPPRRLEVRCSIQLSYRRALHLRYTKGLMCDLLSDFLGG